MRERRTEHAKMVRRKTGTNDFRDKQASLLPPDVMQCIGTFLTAGNLIAVCYT